jgi:hypothetical protein
MADAQNGQMVIPRRQPKEQGWWYERRPLLAADDAQNLQVQNQMKTGSSGQPVTS